MDKKQFDYIENRIREAAENSEPAFDEYAWAKMEARLNKEDNRRHRYLLWWFLLPLVFISAGTGYYFLKNKSPETKNVQHARINSNEDNIEDKSVKEKNVSAEKVPTISEDNPNIKINVDVKKNKSSTQSTRQLPVSNNNIVTWDVTYNSNNYHRFKKGKLFSKTNPGEIADINAHSSEVDSSNIILDTTAINKITADTSIVILSDTVTQKDSLKNTIVVNLPDSSKKDNLKKSTSSRFYFLASVAADIGSVKFLSFQNSQLTPKIGIGIGYQLSKKLCVQTGFYAGEKKYVAGPNDYTAKYGTYYDTVDIVKVNANCLVYDIPITLRYDFLQKPTIKYYTTIGISSFIMKREDYYYYYNYRYNGMPHEHAYQYTGNKNLFSVFNFSIGLEKKLSPYFSLLAEPYFSIPLSGVGEGSVKLYSAGLQVGLKYTPYRKHK